MKLVRDFTDLLNRFIGKKEKSASTLHCYITFTARCLTLLVIDRSNGLKIKKAHTLSLESTSKLQVELNSLIKKSRLKETPTTWLLRPEDYQLFLIESMPVQEDELRDALHWRIRSLITQPIEETIIDYFMIPAKKSTPDSPMIAAVTGWSKNLNKIIEIFKKTGLILERIDIPELALKSLTNHVEETEKSIACLYFYEQTVILNITRKNVLYFTRRINFVLSQDNQRHEAFGLDILRYFDYYQSQWRLPTPSKLYVASDKAPIDTIIKSLSESLLISVEQLKLTIDDLPKDNEYLLPVGCALQE